MSTFSTKHDSVRMRMVFDSMKKISVSCSFSESSKPLPNEGITRCISRQFVGAEQEENTVNAKALIDVSIE